MLLLHHITKLETATKAK